MFPELNIGVSLPTYYLLVSLACVASSLWFIRRADARGLARVTAIDLTLVLLLAGFVGARLLHVGYEEPEFYAEHPLAVLYLWNGGFVYLGGVIGAGFAALLFCQFRREPFWSWADVAAAPIGLGYGIGRLGCLLNGCCYGRECHLPWSIHLLGADRHPTQAYAALWSFALTAFILRFERRPRGAGVVFNVWLIGFSVGRIVMEYFRDDPRGPGLLGASLGLWLSLLMAVGAAANLLRR